LFELLHYLLGQTNASAIGFHEQLHQGMATTPDERLSKLERSGNRVRFRYLCFGWLFRTDRKAYPKALIRRRIASSLGSSSCV
jgi:hypothetical protein